MTRRVGSQESKSEENPLLATPAREGWSSADTFAIVSIACAAEAIPVVGIVFGYLRITFKSKRLSWLSQCGFHPFDHCDAHLGNLSHHGLLCS
jgi:hypothetical protein